MDPLLLLKGHSIYIIKHFIVLMLSGRGACSQRSDLDPPPGAGGLLAERDPLDRHQQLYHIIIQQHLPLDSAGVQLRWRPFVLCE